MKPDAARIVVLITLLCTFSSLSIASILEEETTKLTNFLLNGWNQLLNSTLADRSELSLDNLFDLDHEDAAHYDEGNWELESKKSDDVQQSENVDLVRRKNFFRVGDKVFSRIELPEIYRPPKSQPGAWCSAHIGCLDEVTTLPSLLSWGNVSASFMIYTETKPKGIKIKFEPVNHYQLEDPSQTESEIQEKLNSSQQVTSGSRSRSTSVTFLQSQPLRVTARSWQTATKVRRKQEFPFDLAALEHSGFNSSKNTRVIIGGYFAKEDEKWINEVVRNWLRLEPGNVIKVSWADSNRGLYHSAAFNSRIVGRQLTLLLHYLDRLYELDFDKLHLVGHSLGAHIAGFVGLDFDGQLARITGLDPAGPIFTDLRMSVRLDPSDAKFVDVVHTNGGSLTRGALGMSMPLGHVDYYPNGGAIQPGCLMTGPLADPVERVACNHRRSYRYFIEILRLRVREVNNMLIDDSRRRSRQESFSRMPYAFLFEADSNGLDKIQQPDLNFIPGGQPQVHSMDFRDLPFRRRVEFHQVNPRNYSPDRRGLYIFRTRSESPFFAGRQFGLTIKTQTPSKRRISISLRLGDRFSLADIELDEIPPVITLSFMVDDVKFSRQMETSSLSLMWRYRTFYLLSNQPNEWLVSGISLIDLESADRSKMMIQYSAQNSTVSSSDSNRQQQQLTGSGTELALVRNRWYRFDGRTVDLV